ncbi:MAG: hypothetical protein WBX02_19605, partial [Terriglobales bacterium]
YKILKRGSIGTKEGLSIGKAKTKQVATIQFGYLKSTTKIASNLAQLFSASLDLFIAASVL